MLMPTIDIYTTPTCGFCAGLKKFLAEHNVEYVEHDVTTDPEAFEEMQALSGGSMQVPFTVFNKGQSDQTTQIGFDAAKVSEVLGL